MNVHKCRCYVVIMLHNFDQLCIPFPTSQTRSSTWSQTVINYKSDKAMRLPFIDVGIRDVGTAEQQFWLEIGPVCYYTEQIPRTVVNSRG